MCWLIHRIAATLFAAMPILSVSSTGAMEQEWRVRIPGMLALAIGMGPQLRGVLRVTWPRVRQDTGRQSRQDMQLRERRIGPAWLPEGSLDMGHAPALRVRRVRQAPPRQRQLRLRLQWVRRPLRSVTLVDKR